MILVLLMKLYQKYKSALTYNKQSLNNTILNNIQDRYLLEEAGSHIVTSATDHIVEQGVMGSFVVLFFIVASVLLWVLLRDKEYQKKNADTLSDMVENQKLFTQLYQNSQAHHKEVVKLITDVTITERSNAKDCYNKVDSKLTEVLMHVKGVSHA